MSWHVACGSTVFADGGATSDRYLIALVGYDAEDSINGDLKFIITVGPGRCCSPHHWVPFDSCLQGL